MLTKANYDQAFTDLAKKIETTYSGAETGTLKGLWIYLQESETKLLLLMDHLKPSDSLAGNIEYGPLLYLLNNDFPTSLSFLKTLLVKLGMPASAISTATWNSWQAVVNGGPGVVGGDGTLISTVRFAQLDTGWTLAALSYLYYYYLGGTKAPFGTTPANITVSNKSSLIIAVLGDWGSGSWKDGTYNSPSLLVAKAISGLKPDITLRLGDVYYSGLSSEESANLLSGFPAGSLYNFTLNSNHEMYDGANGYFGTALTDPLFSAQKNTSYFVINYLDWVLIALDSAYYDTSFFVMHGGLDAVQQSFVQQLQIPATKKVIVFTHHTAITTDGSAINNAGNPNNLFGAVYTALNKRYPDFWYYGHTHNGIVYNDKSVTKKYQTVFNKHPEVRCIGHGSIPFGNGYDLHDARNNPITAVNYYAHTPIPGADTQQTNRVLNGFALLTLSAGRITETAYEVSPDGSVDSAWTKTSIF
jgi:hypothetical protein